MLRLVSYRVARPVTQVRLLQSGTCYPVCPRCKTLLDREYMRFCDECGQKLAWHLLPVAAQILHTP